MIGLNGLKFWARQQKKQQQMRLEEAENATDDYDIKDKFIIN